MGAIPFLIIQMLMVAILVAFPGLASTEQTQQRISDGGSGEGVAAAGGRAERRAQHRSTRT